MKRYIIRRNRRFCIDENQLKPEANKTPTKGALYAAVYSEFIDANKNPKYSNLNYAQRLDKLNEFVLNWLKDRGLE